ncbi:Ig kappa chain V19-17-like, partial [Clarias magur]
LLSESLCSLTLEAEVGDKVTIWCQHDLEHPDKIFWFKHTSDSVPLLLGCKRFLTSAPSVDCTFFTESERIMMSVQDKNTSLTITAVNVSDTGLYYCSYSDPMIFSNSTSLHVKDNESVKTLFPFSGGNGNSDNTKGCVSPAVFFMLTLGFGAVSVILLSVLIFIILKHRKTLTGVEAADNQ